MFPALQTRLRFCHAFTSEKVGRTHTHTHPFWQLEQIRKGPVLLEETDKLTELVRGQMVLIPPGCEHRFLYPDTAVAWTSCKFDLTGLTPPGGSLLLPEGPISSALGEVLSLMVEEAQGHPHERINHLIAAILVPTAIRQEQPQSPEEAFIARIEEAVRIGQGSPLSVKELASRLGYQPGYLAKRFKEIKGESLKGFIDAERMARARDLLRYSPLSVSEVAHSLGFPEIYAFSRFFTRHQGTSPSRFRRC